jgi:uracil-DNA glycosylase family 4
MMPALHDLPSLNDTIIACRLCPRLVEWREQVARTKRKAYATDDYWGRPVPGFGDPNARVMAVGLAPGAHGSNRTGRQFTGDASGNFLFPALFRAGFANRPESSSRDDGLELRDLYITAAARCAPPGNKPLPGELNNCQPYLERELELIRPEVIVALGRIAFERILHIYRRQSSSFDFSHGAAYELDEEEQASEAGQRPMPSTRWLLASYHPSQQNTLTGRLTVEMFDAIWEKAKGLIE